MSIAICVYVPEAIVLASDSRQMAQFERRPFFQGVAESPMEEMKDAPLQRFVVTATDTAEKVFNFFDRAGVTAVGEHVLDGQPLSFEIRNCVYNECNAESSVERFIPVRMRNSSWPVLKREEVLRSRKFTAFTSSVRTLSRLISTKADFGMDVFGWGRETY